MKINLVYVFSLVIFISCEIKGVNSDKSENDTSVDLNESEENSLSNENITPETEKEIGQEQVERVFENGIKITWHKRGGGKKISEDMMVAIDYRNSLEDGKVYDGNHLIDKKYIPFYVGWNQQTEGWDFALKELNVGDDVDIFIPANLARGAKGIPELVPPNANNLLSIRVLDELKPDTIVDGIKLWRLEKRKEAKQDSILIGTKVDMHYWASTKSNPRYDNSYQRGVPFSLIMGDGNIVPGLYKALHFLHDGEKALIHIPAEEAYGDKGLKDLVKPNEDLLYDVLIMNVY